MHSTTTSASIFAHEAHIDSLIQHMTLAEKIGQMTQVEKNSITPEEVAQYAIGSVLSGGGGNPSDNTPRTWADMVRSFLEAGQRTRLRIPVIYGVDAVHGHNNVIGAVIFPHNIGLGATRDADLVERIGAITAREMLATHVHWTFAPAVSVPQDMRWGRTYEGFSENTDLVIDLALAFARGLEHGQRVLHSFKHFAGDGGTTWGSTRLMAWNTLSNWQAATPFYKIDQGDTRLDEEALRDIHMRPYRAAIEAGALNIMVSFSSWNGQKMHAHRYLLTEVLKEEWGFAGFIVSDWMAVDQLDADYDECVVQSINAGVDMVMTPYDFKRFINALTAAVDRGAVTQRRIDDAVRRILRAKFALGLFEQPYGDESLLAEIGSAAHRAVAREAVRKSAVLLKNENATLPLSKSLPTLLLAGSAADDIGVQCGGWTISWQGERGATTPGTSILDALRQTVSPDTRIVYEAEAHFDEGVRAEIGVVVIGEAPYAEGFGDNAHPVLSGDDLALIRRARAHCDRLIVLLVSGRPLIVTDALPMVDAFAALWWFGTEALGVTDVLFGDYPFSGRLSFTWARSVDQLPLAKLQAEANAPLWYFGEGS